MTAGPDASTEVRTVDASRGDGGAPLLAVLIGAQLLIWIDNTILNVALKTLADPVSGLGATPEQLEWALNSYTLAFASFMLVGGALGDRFGRREVFMVGIVVFGAASAWAAWAGSANELIAARAVMGVGSALIVPTTLGIIRASFAEGPARSRAVGLWSAASGLAIALGPLVGGVLLESFWWGSVFLVNVPVAAVALVAAWFIVPRGTAADRPPLDPLGALLSAAGLGALVYGIIEGGRLADWTSTRVLLPITVGVVLIGVFVFAEARMARPSFDIALFRHRGFTAASFGVALTFFGLVGSMYYSVFYLQGVRGLSPLECGVVLVPVALGVLFGAPLGVRLAAHLGPRAVAAPALVIVSLTLLGYALLTTTTPLGWYAALLFAQGLAMGTAVAPLTDAVVQVLPRDRASAGAAIMAVLRQVGAVLGVAVLGSLLAGRYRSEIAGFASEFPAPVAEAVQLSAEAARHGLTAAGRGAEIAAVDQAYLNGMYVTTAVAAAVALLGAIVVAVVMPGRSSAAAAAPFTTRPSGTAPSGTAPSGIAPSSTGTSSTDTSATDRSTTDTPPPRG